jgi:diguanylate cyclase (GGDEF)-like protein
MKFNKKIVFICICILFIIAYFVVTKFNKLSEINYKEKSEIQKAKVLIQKGNYDLAEKKLESILGSKDRLRALRKDDKFNVYNYLGVINMFQGETVNSLLMYENAEKYVSNVNKYKVEINTAIVYRQMGEYLKSAEILSNINRTKDKNKIEDARIKTYAMLNLAEIYLQIGNYKEYRCILNQIEKYIDYIPKAHKDDLLIMYYSSLIISDIHDNKLDKIHYYFNKINELEKSNTEVYYTENKMLKIRAYARYYKKVGDTEKSIKYFGDLEGYAQKEGDTYILQSSIKERIEIYKKLAKKEKYNALIEKLYNKQKEISIINNKQYNFHLNNKILEQGQMNIMKKAVVIFIFMNICLIATIILIYRKMKKSKTDSIRDALCNIYNRRYLEFYRKKASKKDLPLSILMIDVDYFKLYNDNYGHQRGDEVLKCVAKVLKASSRSSDMVFRYGGEEFCVVLKNTSKKEAIVLAQRIKENMANEKIKHEYSKVDNYITLSIGISTIYSNEGIRNAINLADKALYISKENGRNRYIHIENI